MLHGSDLGIYGSRYITLIAQIVEAHYAREMVRKLSTHRQWSEENLSTALNWLEEYQNGQGKHRRSSESQKAQHSSSDARRRFLPTWLVKLQRSNQGFWVCLRQKQCMTGTEPYVTLSCYWGDPRSTKIILTQDRLELFCEEIDSSTLPPIFQAIQIAQSLNIEYFLD